MPPVVPFLLAGLCLIYCASLFILTNATPKRLQQRHSPRWLFLPSLFLQQMTGFLCLVAEFSGAGSFSQLSVSQEGNDKWRPPTAERMLLVQRVHRRNRPLRRTWMMNDSFLKRIFFLKKKTLTFEITESADMSVYSLTRNHQFSYQLGTLSWLLCVPVSLATI